MKYYWAYNMPCAIMVSEPLFWKENLKKIYEMLYKDILINIRTAMSSGFKEVIELV
jgi:small nuclear ribonucleoprotein (snRNP)-like protein